MEHRVPMGVGRAAMVVLTVVMVRLSSGCLVPRAFAQTASQTSNSTAKSAQDTSSSNPKAHRRRTTVQETEGSALELTKAEELIQKKDFAQAEPLLKKVVASDASNYVAW